MKFCLLAVFAFLGCIQGMKRARSSTRDEDEVDPKQVEVSALTLIDIPDDLLMMIMFQVATETPNHFAKGYYSLVSKGIYAFLESPNFLSLVRVHPATRFPIFLCQKTFNLANDKNVFDLIKPQLTTITISKLIQKAVGTSEIETLMELSGPDPQFDTTWHYGVVVNVEPDRIQSPEKPEKSLTSEESFLSTLKSLASEDLCGRKKFGQSYLMVIYEIISEWKTPAYKTQLQDFISKISAFKVWPVSKTTCVIKLLIVPLILAALSNEKSFIEFLPENFLTDQISFNTSDKVLHETLVYLNAYFQGRNSMISTPVLDFIYQHAMDYPFCFKSFTKDDLYKRLNLLFKYLDLRGFTVNCMLDIKDS